LSDKVQKTEATIEKIISIIETDGKFVIKDPQVLNPENQGTYIKNILANVGGWLTRYRPELNKNLLAVKDGDHVSLIFEDI
jgi:hypothetical protein